MVKYKFRELRINLHASYVFHVYTFLCFLIGIQQFALTSFHSKTVEKLQEDGSISVTVEFL